MQATAYPARESSTLARLAAALWPLLAFSTSALAAGPEASDPSPREQAFQDHVAYVATFVMPVLIEKCTALDPAYLSRAAPLYFGFVNAHQDRIERGRLLTLAEFKPQDTLPAYRQRVLSARLGKLDSGTPEQKRGMCEGALGMLAGNRVPGQWPPAD